MRLQTGVTYLAALLLCGSIIQAQTWDTLGGLRPGDRVKILDYAGEVHKGAFAAFTADAISVRTGKGETSIERRRVRRVQVRSSARRVRNILIGAGLGVAAGVVADQSIGRSLRNEIGESSGVRAAGYIAPIGLFAGIGAALPAYKTVYRSQ